METLHIKKLMYVCIHVLERSANSSFMLDFFVSLFSSFPAFTNNLSETHGKDERISSTSSGEHFLIQIQDTFRTG